VGPSLSEGVPRQPEQHPQVPADHSAEESEEDLIFERGDFEKESAQRLR